MNGFLEGIGWGLLLSVLTGPIFFTIVQVSIEKGFREGLALVAGQWFSDYLYIGLMFWGAGYMQALEKDQEFMDRLTFWLGSGGTVFLCILGLILVLVKPKADNPEKPVSKSVSGFLLQGFLINTLTPFPIFFWISLMSAAIGREMQMPDRIGLFTGVMITVMLTDTLKVYAAKKLSSLINAKYVLLIRKIAGLALILSGLSMLIRILLY